MKKITVFLLLIMVLFQKKIILQLFQQKINIKSNLFIAVIFLNQPIIIIKVINMYAAVLFKKSLSLGSIIIIILLLHFILIQI